MLRLIVYVLAVTLYRIAQSMDEPAHEITIMINHVFKDSRNSGDQRSRNSGDRRSRNSAKCSRYSRISRQSAESYSLISD